MKGKKAFRIVGGALKGRTNPSGVGTVGRWGMAFFLFLGLLLAPGLAQANPPATKSATATQTQPCTLLTREEVLEALKASEASKPGKPPTIKVEGMEEDEFPPGVKVCIYSYSLTWNTDKWNHLIRISYQRDPGSLQELKEVKSKMGKSAYPVERLSGLGEEAYWVDNIRLYVWVRGGLLKIDHGFRAYEKDLSIRLAKRALERIR